MNRRRHFVAASGPPPTNASTGTKANPLVLNTDELGQDPADGMDLAVRLGFTRIEFRSAYGSNALMLPTEQLNRIRRLAEHRGLSVAALASPLWKWCCPEADPGRVDTFGFPAHVPLEDRRHWVKTAIEAASILHAPIIRVFSHLRVGCLTEDFAEDPLLRFGLERAAAAGVILLVENEPICTVAHVDSLLTLLQRYRDQGLGLWLDVANLHDLGEATPEAIRDLAPYVRYVQIKDYHRGVDGRKTFCAAGSGDVPYGLLLPALRATCPDVPYALETHVRDTPAQALEAGAAYLRTTIGQPAVTLCVDGAGERGSRG